MSLFSFRYMNLRRKLKVKVESENSRELLTEKKDNYTESHGKFT